MAKLTVYFLLFFVVAFAHARDLADRSENEVSVHDFVAGTVEDSDSKASIFLPSEKLSKYEAPKPIAEPEEVRTESNPSEISAAETTETDSDPLIVITFRPMNRQFPRRSVPLIFRRGRHGCHHRHHFKPWSKTDRVGEVSYGNDMILSDERSSLNPVVNWESDREMEIPSRWTEFRHVGPWDSYRSDRKEDRKHLHHHHFHHRQEDVEEKEAKVEEHEHKEKSGFLRKFRKFLKQFEF